MKTKSIRNTSNCPYIVLILLVFNLAIHTLNSKNLNRITTKGDLENGKQCDTNSHCKSGYCGYNGPMLTRSPPNYDNYACMEKYSKGFGVACWHDKECRIHYGLIEWSNCLKVFNRNFGVINYHCE